MNINNAVNITQATKRLKATFVVTDNGRTVIYD